MDHADDAEVIPPADRADDTEVVPPALQTGEGPPPRGPQCISAAAMRTTRRSSLPRCKRGGSGSARTAVHVCCGYADDTEVIPPADHADDAEVVPPDGSCGRGN
jgi:hypothetical protein